jgi:hypothetical protein
MRAWTEKDRSSRGLAPLAAFAFGLLVGCAHMGGEDDPESPAEATYELPAGCTQIASSSITVTGVATSGDSGGVCQATNPPANSLDGNLSTRSACEGIGSHLTFDLGVAHSLCGVDIAWYQGNLRTNTFKIQASTDGTTFTDILGSTTSSGMTTGHESYSVSGTARYVRIYFQGNNVFDNDWMSVTEVRIGGTTSLSSIHRLPPAADAYVRSGAYANQNFGTSSSMQTDTDDSGTIIQSYVRYSIGNVGTITSAKLRFYITNGTTSGPEIRKISDTTWGETTIIWNNKPAVDGAIMGAVGSVLAGGWVEVDVTSHVTSNSVLSFAMVPRSSDGMGMNTREASNNKPELVISSAQSSCGNGRCETGENSTNCAADCGTTLYTAAFDDGCDYLHQTTCEPWTSKGELDTCEFTCSSVSPSTSCRYGGTCNSSNLDNLKVVTSPSRCASAVKVTLFGGQVRAEMRDQEIFKLDSVAGGEDLGTREYWVGASYYLPSTSEYPNTHAHQAVVLQWHTTNGQVTGGDDGHIGNPVIALRLRWLNNTLTWRVEGEVNATTSCTNCLCTAPGTPTNSCKTGPGSGCSTCETHRTIGTGPAVERNVWYDWAFRVRFSKNDANGYVEAWVRKQGDTTWTLVASETRYNMHPDVYKGGQYLKLGLYGSSTSDARSIYIDQLRVMESTNLSNDATRLADMRRQVDPAICSGGGSSETLTQGGGIEGVEPESHAHFPPMMDSAGNLYRITESPGAAGNKPKMMKSSNGGASWSEMHSAHTLTAKDLEGGWQLQDGNTIYSVFTNDDRVWFQQFNTAAASQNADTWVTEQVVESGLSTSGVFQYASLAQACNGQFWAFYSDKLDVDCPSGVSCPCSSTSMCQQIAFERRTQDSSGQWVWGAAPLGKRDLATDDKSWTGPVSVVGQGDVTHVFYKDHAAKKLYWRKLDCNGNLTAPTTVGSTTHSEPFPHTNAVYYDNSGQENIVIAYATSLDGLKSIKLTSGVAEEKDITTSSVVINPQEPENMGTMGPAAHLAVDGTTVHAVWADGSTGDLMYSKLTHGNTSWSAPTRIWDSGEHACYWVYANIYTRAGSKRLGITCDRGPHVDDVGNIFYGELTLP